MIKLFERIFWHNNTTPAINEDNLNAMSKAIDDIDNRIIQLAADVMETVPQIQAYLEQADDLVEAMELLTKNPPYIGANGNWYVWDTDTSSFVDSGIDASITVDIADVTMLNYGSNPYITNTGTDTDPVFHLYIPRAAGISGVNKTSSSGLQDTYTISFQDGNTATFIVTNGKGISQIAKTSTSGLVDTYTITYNDGTTSTFTVTNGATPDVSNKMDIDGSNAASIVTFAGSVQEGTSTTASGANSHAEGYHCVASAKRSHVEGLYCEANGVNSHVNGVYNVSGYNAQTVIGLYNDNKSDTYFEVGNGTDANARSNAFEVYADGTVSTDNGASKIKLMYLESSVKTTANGEDCFTFTNPNITPTAAFDPYVDVYGVVPTRMVQSGTQMQVYFDSSDNVNSCRLYIK